MKRKPREPKNSKKEKDLWKNPSYKNMLNPYESKYPQKKQPPAVRPQPSAKKKK